MSIVGSLGTSWPVPTLTSLLTEAFKRCGVPSPTAAQLQRGQDEWMQEVLQEIGGEKRWHVMEETVTIASVASQQSYALPEPVERVLAVRFVGADAIARPMIGPVVGLRLLQTATSSQSSRWEEFENALIVDPIPNAATYTYQLDVIVDLSLVAKDDDRFIRLLREWRVVILAGLMVRIKEDQQDDDLPSYRARFEQSVQRMMKRDSRKRRGLLPTAMIGPGGLPRRRL